MQRDIEVHTIEGRIVIEIKLEGGAIEPSKGVEGTSSAVSNTHEHLTPVAVIANKILYQQSNTNSLCLC
jgi:hypothetical protein